MSKQSRARAAIRAVPSPAPNTFLPRWSNLLAGGIILLAALAAYWNSLSTPFVFDDFPAIMENPTIRHLGSAWSPPNRSAVVSRPVVNFSLALNYAVGGFDVWGYHALNLAIHIFAALTLFGLMRRTLLRPVGLAQGYGGQALTSRLATRRSEISNLRFEIGADATPLAFTMALLWAVHPLQTESVTCVVQRTESLMGLFYLLTLYCFVRGVDETGERQKARGQRKEAGDRSQEKQSGFRPLASVLWPLASVLFCLLGMASKEVMVSAPLMVLLYDRTFVAGSFREAWQQRRRWYIGLACTWLLLGYLVVTSGGNRGQAAGFELGLTPWTYALTQCEALIRYLKLSVWPYPLVLDYGTRVVQHPMDVLPQALLLGLLVVATIFGVWRRPALGFVGIWFFAIIAPSSSVVPLVTQTVAEHRMYLSLASVAVLAVLGGYALIGRRVVYAGAGLAVLLTLLTMRRNEDYRSALAIWSDTVTKCPDNARAHNNLGNALLKIPRRLPDALAEYKAALGINPDYAEAHDNFGNALLKMPGHLTDAMAEFETALRLDPDLAKAHDNLGNALMDVPGRLPDAMAEFEAALRLDPDLADAHNNLGSAWLDMPGRLPDAMAEFEAALRLDPDSIEAHDNLGAVFFKMPGRLPDAITQFEAALRLNPDSMEAHSNLGSALLNEPGRLPEAIDQYEAAVRLDPGSAKARYNLGNALLTAPGRLPDAIAQLQAALRINPDLASARELLNQLQNPNGLEGAAPIDSSLHSNDKP